jgi:type III secretion protein Q
MKPLALRHANRHATLLQYAASQWQQLGYAASYRALNIHSRYISFQALSRTEVWSGLVDAKEWLTYFAPEMASLADYFDEQDMLELFSATPVPFDLALPNLSYTQLQIGSIVSGNTFSAQPLICIRTAQGSVWIHKLPEHLVWQQTLLDKRIHALPIPLCFILGYSTISLALSTKLMIGDVLLIEQQFFCITTHSKLLGNYQLTEGGIQVENFNEDISPDIESDQSMQALPESAIERDSSVPYGRIPIKLEFVLEERSIAVAELTQLAPGAILELKHDAEQHITIRANGVILAKGELVQLDDRLGVEIKTIYANPT